MPESDLRKIAQSILDKDIVSVTETFIPSLVAEILTLRAGQVRKEQTDGR